MAAVLLVLLGAAALPPAWGQASRPRAPHARARRTPRVHAPILRARGDALNWTRAGKHNRYRLLISVLEGRAHVKRRMLTVVGRSFAPPAVPGRTVVYRVQAASHESGWSNTTAITFRRRAALRQPTEKPLPAPGAAAAAGVVPDAQGAVKYLLDAATYFDQFAAPQFAPWVRGHVAMIRGYPPFSNSFASLFGVPVVAYHDPATEGQAPLGPAEIATFVGKVERDMQAGHAGVFIDNANWSAGFAPSPGPRANLANLIEAIRAAEPDAVIEINSHWDDIWPLMQAGDPDVARALRYVSVICEEFGVGPTSGIDTAHWYGEFMQYADALHAKGIALTLTGDRFHNDVPTMEYNLATYFLINDGHDFVSGTNLSPASWWPGFDVDLGNAVSARELLPGGVWTRRFSRGVVYTLQPGSPPQTISLGRTMHSAEWGDVQSVTLSAGQGAVLAE